MRSMGSLSIGEVAKRAGLRTSAVRYYESIGLLPAPERKSGQRRFDTSVLHRLELIRVAQGMGFTLKEIKTLFSEYPPHTRVSTRWKTLTASKIPEIDGLIARAQKQKGWLQLLAHCECTDLDTCAGTVRQARTSLGQL